MELERRHRARQGVRTQMCARVALLAVPLLACLALGQEGAVEKATFGRMDDGVQLNTSVFIPDGPAPPSGWPAIVFVHGLGGSNLLSQILFTFSIPIRFR